MAKPRNIPLQNLHSALIIGQNIKNIRTKRGLTQLELAEQIGLTRTAIANYEAGKVRILDITLIDLSQALNVSADELLGLKKTDADTPSSRRLMKRAAIIETLPEPTKKHIIKVIDELVQVHKQ
jgi:repressor LexA